MAKDKELPAERGMAIRRRHTRSPVIRDKQLSDGRAVSDPARAIPEGAEVFYQGQWLQINRGSCNPPYQFMEWETSDPSVGTILVGVTRVFMWRRPGPTKSPRRRNGKTTEEKKGKDDGDKDNGTA